MFAHRLAVPSLVAALIVLGLGLFPDNATLASDPPTALGLAVTAPDDPAMPVEAPGNALVTPLSPFAPTYSGCGGDIAPITNAAYEQELVELVNAQRLANGSLPPYKRVASLDDAARYHAADMAQDNYFDHNSYDRNAQNNLVLVCAWNTRVGKHYKGVYGENIAAGYSTPASVMTAWMNSSGHRGNILSGAWEIGVGYSSQGGSYGVYWVQDFGKRTDIYPLVINREGALTALRSVALYIYGSGVFQQMRLKNENGNFTEWQPFQTNLPWTLSGCNGAKSVTAELKNATSTVTSTDAITLAVNPAQALGGLPDTLKFIYSITDQRLVPAIGTFIPQNNGDGCAMPYTVSTDGSWFSLSAASGATPAPFTLTPSSFDTSPGTYTGSVTVTVTGANGSPHTTSLSLEVVNWTVLQTFLPVVSR